MQNKIRFSLYYEPILGKKVLDAIMQKALEINVISEQRPHEIAQFLHPSLAKNLGLKENEIAIIIVNNNAAKCVQTRHELERYLGANGTAKYYGFVFDVNDFKVVEIQESEPKIIEEKAEEKPVLKLRAESKPKE